MSKMKPLGALEAEKKCKQYCGTPCIIELRSTFFQFLLELHKSNTRFWDKGGLSFDRKAIVKNQDNQEGKKDVYRSPFITLGIPLERISPNTESVMKPLTRAYDNAIIR